MSLTTLARSAVLVTLANLVPRAGAFLLLPIYTHFLTRGDFGIVSLASSVGLLLAIAARLGLDAALLRMHHEHRGARQADLYASVVVVTLIAAALLVTVGLAVLLTLPREMRIAGLLALALGLANTVQYVPSVWLRSTDRTGAYLLLALVAFAAVAVVTLIMVVIAGMGAVGSLTGQLAGAVVVAVAAGLVLWSMRPWRLRRRLAREALAFGLPLLPQTVSGWILNVSDRWLLGLLLGVAAADALAAIGVYSLGYQLGYIVALAAVSVQAAWLPMLYRIGDGAVGSAFIRESTTVAVAAFTIAATGLSILAPDLVRLVAPPEWAAAADVTAVVAFASAAQGAALMVASGLYLRRRLRVMPVLTLAADGANVALNVILVPRIGIMGAAWATFGAFALLASLTTLAAARERVLHLDAVRVGLLGAVALVAIVLVRAGVVGDPGLAGRLLVLLLVATAMAWICLAPLRRLQRLLAPGEPGDSDRMRRSLEEP
jgi:O-antigen/teichoic acid export membrane protein